MEMWSATTVNAYDIAHRLFSNRCSSLTNFHAWGKLLVRHHLARKKNGENFMFTYVAETRPIPMKIFDTLPQTH